MSVTTLNLVLFCVVTKESILQWGEQHPQQNLSFSNEGLTLLFPSLEGVCAHLCPSSPEPLAMVCSMTLFISIQTGDRVQSGPELTLFKIWKVWKLRWIDLRGRVSDVQCLRHLPSLQLLLHWSEWLLQPGDNQALLGKDGVWYSGVVWICATVEMDRAHLWSIAAHWLMAWGDGQNHLLSQFILCTGRECLCFLRARTRAQPNPKAGKEKSLFCLYTSWFLEQVKGQFHPHCSLGQYWEFPEITPYLS